MIFIYFYIISIIHHIYTIERSVVYYLMGIPLQYLKEIRDDGAVNECEQYVNDTECTGIPSVSYYSSRAWGDFLSKYFLYFFFGRQLALADRIVLNKVDLVSPEDLGILHNIIRCLFLATCDPFLYLYFIDGLIYFPQND